MNVERVQKDEQDAREKEERDEKRLADADRHDRLAALRRKRDGIEQDGQTAALTDPAGHMNFWQAHEDGHVPDAPPPPPRETSLKESMEKSALELQPWYAQTSLRNGREGRKTDEERARAASKDTTRKATQDPLTALHAQLGRGTRGRAWVAHAPPEAPSTDPVRERAEREKREKARVAALRAEREAATPDADYSDQFFRAETRAARDARVGKQSTYRRRFWR